MQPHTEVKTNHQAKVAAGAQTSGLRALHGFCGRASGPACGPVSGLMGWLNFLSPSYRLPIASSSSLMLRFSYEMA
jgi:hypothetical protein